LYFVVYDAVYEEEHLLTTVSFPALPQLVSRQFWAETSEVFLSTCTFRFNYEFNFRRFALSYLPTVPRVRWIMIYARPCWSSGWLNHFGSHVPYDPDDIIRMYYMVGNLKSLGGMKFSAELVWLFDESVREPDLSVDQWAKAEMPKIVRTFQQHRLRPDLTSAVLKRPFHHQPEFRYLLGWHTGEAEDGVRN